MCNKSYDTSDGRCSERRIVPRCMVLPPGEFTVRIPETLTVFYHCSCNCST